MEEFLPIDLHLLAMFGFICFAITVILIRIQATKKPTSAKKILIPPLGMSTGFLMFLYPPARIPWEWAVIAFIAGGILLSIPLIKTSQFHIVNQEIYLKRSPAFIVILGILLVVRISLHGYIEQHISLLQTAGFFFILAFGMLLPWRIVMYFEYQKMQKRLAGTAQEKPTTELPQ